jgi:hypothetical protein
MTDYFKLDGKAVVPVDDVMIWAEWLERAERRIALDEVAGAVISTVFLGVNPQWGDGPPLVFETLVSGGQLDGEMDRYSTWDEAAAGHVAMCVKVKLAEAGETVANA